jgi:hypothetical protein
LLDNPELETNAEDQNNWAPIHQLLKNPVYLGPQDQQLVDWLIQRNAGLEPHQKFDLQKAGGQKKWTPLHVAAYHGNLEGIYLLSR